MLSREDFDHYLEKLEKLKYDKSLNLSDFWFANKTELSKSLFGGVSNGMAENFGQIIRWHSNLGKCCQEKIIEQIILVQENNLKVRSDNFNNGNFSFTYALIEFSKFTFIFEGKEYNINSFSQLFDTSRISGISDLRGINLNDIKFYDSCIRNCFFSLASFTNSSFSQVLIENTNFVKANFTNSWFGSVKLDKYSRLGGAVFRNAFLNALDFNSDIMPDGIVFNEISYFSLVKRSFDRLISNSNTKKRPRGHTEFLLIDTNGLDSPEVKNLKRYIDWYENVNRKMGQNNPHLNSKAKLGTFLNVLTTKYWSSYSVLAVFSIFVNFFFATAFWVLREGLQRSCELELSFFDCFYYSIVTFTTLGYGDITPISWHTELVVILNVFTGYIILGVFIFLLSKKVELDTR